MATKGDILYQPSPSESEQIRDLYRLFLLENKSEPALVGPNGSIKIPRSIYDILAKVITYMAQGKAVSVMPVMQELTTQQAAAILGVSRPFLIKLLDNNQIQFHRTGAHRRIYLKHVLEFQARRDAERSQALTNLAKRDLERGEYDKIHIPEESE